MVLDQLGQSFTRSSGAYIGHLPVLYVSYMESQGSIELKWVNDLKTDRIQCLKTMVSREDT